MSKKDEILEVAIESLQKKGVNGFSFRDLADAVGVKSSSVHYHFPNKSELFKAILTRFGEQFLTLLKAVEEESTSLEELCTGFIAVFEGVLAKDRFCVCGMFAVDQQHLEPEVIEYTKASFEAVESWLATAIEAYPETKVAALSIARLLIASCEGALLVDWNAGNQDYFKAMRDCLPALLV